MKRSGFKPRTTPMARTAFKSTGQPMKRTAMKASRPKTTKIRQSARGEKCTINLLLVCLRTSETTVWCHSNRYEHGKGMGLKADDQHGAYGCASCHAVYDRQAPLPFWLTREQVETSFTRAMERSRSILAAKGLVQDPVEPAPDQKQDADA